MTQGCIPHDSNYIAPPVGLAALIAGFGESRKLQQQWRFRQRRPKP